MVSQQSSTTGKKGTGINIDEFLQIVSSCQGDAFDFHEEITRGFSLMDKDKDGFISMQDLKTLCKEMDITLKDEELDDMIYEADSDGDGKVSKEEFVKMMLRTCLYSQQI
jgi:centrin-1